MKQKKNVQIILINIVCVLALMLVVFPLLLIAQYDYPSADDWSFSIYSYNAVKNGEGIIGALMGALEAVKHYYINWEGRFSIAFLGALQPGIWGEKYYAIVAWMMIGAIIISEMFLMKNCLCENNRKENRWLWLPIIVPVLILQILYVPAPIESFYWYNGSVNYTFVYGLSLVLLVLFVKMGKNTYPKWKYILMAIAACLLAILVGGDNFATSLSCLLTLCVLSCLFWLYDKKALLKTWYVTLIMGICLMLCIVAPGNKARINGNFGGETGGAIEAILMSLVRSATNIYSWTNIKVILMILFIIPFAWKCVKNISYEFKLPGIFTLLTFGLYASQITATMYVDGTTGGGRMADILFYSYNVWMIGNVIYWLGWLNKRQNRVQKLMNDFQHRFGKLLLPYCAVIGAILVCIIYTNDLRQITSYRAYRDWRQGWAQQYAAEWDARIAVLKDENVKGVEFTPLSVYPEMILYTDLQDEEGYTWVNTACASYYGKEWITIVPPKN